MTRSQALENMRAAHRVIEDVSADPAQVSHAEEVRAACALTLLRYEAEEQAAELMAVDRRRRELLVFLRAYHQGEFTIGEQSRATFKSRKISAALLLASESIRYPDSDNAPDIATARWNTRLKEIANTKENCYVDIHQ